MSNLIPTKIITDEGIIAIKNGIKPNKSNLVPVERKPSWLRVNLNTSSKFKELKKIVHQKKLNTVCEEAMCPNINECWNHGTATFMLLGSVCTRACKFCAVDTGNPKRKLDSREPHKVATSISLMNIKYAVLTSVNRDDLTDGGADHYAKTVKAIKEMTPEVTVEALAPDFLGQKNSIELLLDSGLEVFAQNLETVDRLTSEVRDSRAGYRQTLEVLSYSKQFKPRPWSISIEGLVEKPGLIDLEDLIKEFTVEDRIYRLRCVEAWSMVIPWQGFSLKGKNNDWLIFHINSFQ